MLATTRSSELATWFLRHISCVSMRPSMMGSDPGTSLAMWTRSGIEMGVGWVSVSKGHGRCSCLSCALLRAHHVAMADLTGHSVYFQGLAVGQIRSSTDPSWLPVFAELPLSCAACCRSLCLHSICLVSPSCLIFNARQFSSLPPDHGSVTAFVYLWGSDQGLAADCQSPWSCV